SLAKNVHSTQCITHKGIIITQSAHNDKQTQGTDCDRRKSQSNNSLGRLWKADPSIRNDHRAEIIARGYSSAPYFCFLSFHTVTSCSSEPMLTSITIAGRSQANQAASKTCSTHFFPKKDKRTHFALPNAIFNIVAIEGGEMAQWLECELTDRKVRGSNPTSASRLSLSRLRQPDSISALVLPSGGMASNHQKDDTAERLF
ncbi:hypothetical protein CSKR_100752, partial [Clonorchis sinensis]